MTFKSTVINDTRLTTKNSILLEDSEEENRSEKERKERKARSWKRYGHLTFKESMFLPGYDDVSEEDSNMEKPAILITSPDQIKKFDFFYNKQGYKMRDGLTNQRVINIKTKLQRRLMSDLFEQNSNFTAGMKSPEIKNETP